MKLRKTGFILLVIFCILITFSACNAQGEVDLTQKKTEQKPVGEIVSELDTKANLIYQDKAGNYWFGSKEKGVYKYDGERLFLYTTKDGLADHSIISVQEDKAGNVYFDTQDGVSKFDGRKFTELKVMENDSSKNEWKSTPDDLWFRIGWDKRGPYRYDGKNLYHLEFPENKMEDEFYAKNPNAGFNPYSIYSIYKDSKGNMWFGTADMGVYRFDGKNVSWMYEKHLMETSEGGAFGVRSIVEDKDGYIRITNSAYKYKILPDKFEGKEPFPINYKREKGFAKDEKEAEYFMAMVTGKNGDLWMVNADGVRRSIGKDLVQLPIENGKKSVSVTSIFKDNKDVIWIGTQSDGSYKYNGKTFEKFTIN